MCGGWRRLSSRSAFSPATALRTSAKTATSGSSADLAIQLARAVHVPIHPTLAGPQIAWQLRHCGCRVVFLSGPHQAAKLAPLAAELPANFQFFSFDATNQPWPAANRAIRQPLRTRQSRGRTAARKNRPRAVEPDSLATILYTSGTTGEPKGVMLTQGNLAANAVGPYGRVIGADLAERLLVMAQAKADAQKLTNATFRQADMENLGYSDDLFDAVVCVFAIFFVPDMVKQVRELWRMVRAGGQLAITTWGPRMFEPGSAAWWAAVKQFRPDLHAAFNPWERIITPQAVRQLLTESGIENADVIAEQGQQALQSPEDWWTVVLGSGYRWTVEQMDHETEARVRE